MSAFTTVDQDGEYAGEEVGRVWIRQPSGWVYYGVGSVARARELCEAARLAVDPTTVLREYCEAEVQS